MDDQEIKIILENAKTIAMIGISSEKKKGGSKENKKKASKCSDEIYARFWLQSVSNQSFCRR